MADLEFPRISRLDKTVDDPKRIGMWKIGRTIGKGSSGMSASGSALDHHLTKFTSGRVRIARHSKSGQYAAVKIISKISLPSQVSLNNLADHTERNQLAIEREIVVMKLIDHPNIMHLYDVWETSTELYLILEYVQGGELFEYLCDKGRLPTSEALGYFQQIVGAMDYCHRFNIAHRDLKPENILLDQDFNIKIADFGMAAWQTSNGMLRTSCGSPHYAAPEVVGGEAYIGSAADIWSCGIILHALLTGKLPFDDEDLLTLLEKVLRGKFEMPSDIDPLAQDLLTKMLTVDPKKRITMPGILEHPFFVSKVPKIVDRVIPSLEHIARPIGTLASIDPDIFANIRTLWHGTPDADLIDSLRNGEQNWQKGIYHLLVDYRTKNLENSVEGEDAAPRRKKSKKRRSKAESLGSRRPYFNEAQLTPSPSSFPPREDPPTPRRASGQGRAWSSASCAPLCDEKQFADDIPAINLYMSSPLSNVATTPLSSTWGVLDLPPLTVPELQDDKVQAFFHQIVDHLNALQARTFTPDANNWSTSSQFPHTDANALPPAPLNMHPGQFANIRTGTRPLSVRRKPQPTRPTIKTDLCDKENLNEDYLIIDGPGNVMRKSSLKKRRKGRANLVDKKVHIVEPPERERSRLKKKRSVGPLSPAFSDAGSSFTLPPPSPSSPISSSPKRTWLGNVFKFKPATYTLMSTHSIHTTRNECRRLLMGMDIRVILESSEGLGVLKCRLDEIKDPSGVMSVLKPVKFRVEVRQQHHEVRTEQHDYPVSLHLVEEKGSTETFKEVCHRLRREWSLDVVGGGTPSAVVASPGLTGGGRFSEVQAA